jgi:hypothetical protein
MKETYNKGFCKGFNCLDGSISVFGKTPQAAENLRGWSGEAAPKLK